MAKKWISKVPPILRHLIMKRRVFFCFTLTFSFIARTDFWAHKRLCSRCWKTYCWNYASEEWQTTLSPKGVGRQDLKVSCCPTFHAALINLALWGTRWWCSIVKEIGGHTTCRFAARPEGCWWCMAAGIQQMLPRTCPVGKAVRAWIRPSSCLDFDIERLPEFLRWVSQFIYPAFLRRTQNSINIYSRRFIEGSLEVKLPTIFGQMEKQRWEESRRRRKEVRRSEKRKREKKEDAGARKGRKVAIHCVFSKDLWLRRVEK